MRVLRRESIPEREEEGTEVKGYGLKLEGTTV